MLLLIFIRNPLSNVCRTLTEPMYTRFRIMCRIAATAASELIARVQNVQGFSVLLQFRITLGPVRVTLGFLHWLLLRRVIYFQEGSTQANLTFIVGLQDLQVHG